MVRVIASLVVLAAVPARADGFYFTESFGGSDVKGDLAADMPSAVALRLGLGMRTGPGAVAAHIGAHVGAEEGTTAAHDLRVPHERFESLTTFGVDLKYIQPLSRHLEAYLRGGLSYGMIVRDYSVLDDYSGRGAVGGAGIQLKGKVRALGFLAWPFFFLKIGPKVTGAVWLDASYQFYRLHPGGRLDATPSIDAKITTLSGGFAIGSDF